jgi:hypothetical protein
VRLATTAGALILGVLAVFLGMQSFRAGASPFVVMAVLVVIALPALVLGKLYLDRRLLGGAGTRRTQDTRALGDLLGTLPPGWWVYADFFLGGSGVEYLVVGPSGLYAVEVFRWLARDTGTAFHEKVASELNGRSVETAAALTRLTGSRQPLAVQPVYVATESEGVRVGDILLHPAAPDLYHLRGVIVATRENLLPLLRSGGPQYGVRTRPLEPELVDRLGRMLAQKAGA